ncbi:MAG TPA: arginase family protein [Actinomycetota bacterium]|nr:arginase family protein [Actinomycetota bacterium]
MTRVRLLGVPWAANGRTDGVARGITALRSAGLVEALEDAGHDVADAGDLHLGPRRTDRDQASGLIDPAGLASMVRAVGTAVSASPADGWLPVVVGGDCPVLLGAVGGVGATGLVHVDGHEDAYPPSRSPTGSAADCEIAFASGLAVMPGEPAGTPRTDLAHLAVVGPRDRPDLDRDGVASIADRCLLLDDAAVRADPHGAAALAIGRAADAAGGFWLHLDVDVLANDQIRAVRFPRAGGLRWDDLRVIVAAGLAQPRCRGWTITTFNPDLDQEVRDARRIVAFVAEALRAVPF